MTLYIALAAGLLWAATMGASFYYGTTVGEDSVIAQQARENSAITKTQELARMGAAEAIAANKPRNVTIRQETEREIRTNTIYAECKHSAEQLQRLNSAIAGGGTKPAGGGQLPTPVTAE